jgi:cytidylate kinase
MENKSQLPVALSAEHLIKIYCYAEIHVRRKKQKRRSGEDFQKSRNVLPIKCIFYLEG